MSVAAQLVVPDLQLLSLWKVLGPQWSLEHLGGD